jgi:hypothetical protein
MFTTISDYEGTKLPARESKTTCDDWFDKLVDLMALRTRRVHLSAYATQIVPSTHHDGA